MPILFALIVILLGAKLGGELFERMGQPAVLGELIAGVIIGNVDTVFGTNIFGLFRSGPVQEMLPVFDLFESHPLLIQVLAGEVARFRDAPGDFDAWRTAHSNFDPFALPMLQVRSHVLAAALRGLTEEEARTLHVMAGFRMPTSIYTLKALLIRSGEEGEDAPEKKPFASLGELDRALGLRPSLKVVRF